MAQFCLYLNLNFFYNQYNFINLFPFYIFIHFNHPQKMECQPTHEQQQAFQQFVDQVMNQCLDEDLKPQFYVPQQREIIRLKNNLVSNSFIIYGTGGSGKTSSVIWAASYQPQIKLIIINCEIYSTQQQFIQSLHNGVRYHTRKQTYQKENNSKKSHLVFENLKFDQLNQQILNSGNKFVFVIRKCQKIAQMKKPTLFYNLLEWINGTMKPYLGLVFLSRAFHFTDRLQKRVKSRLTAKNITLIRPQGQKIIKIYVKRFEILQNRYLKQEQIRNYRRQKKSHKLSLKSKWIEKLIISVQNNQNFKALIKDRINAINNQFLTIMKIALLKSLTFTKIANMPQKQFNLQIIEMLKDASKHISPGYVHNLIKQCPLYSILALSILAYIGTNQRTPYSLQTVFEVYKQKVVNNSRFSTINMFCSKRLFENALQRLLDAKIIRIVGQQDRNEQYFRQGYRSDREVMLAIPAEDVGEIIWQTDDIPEIVKDILKAG